MSGSENNLLARWSQRKRDVAEEGAEPSPPRGERVAPKGPGEGPLDSGVVGENPSPNPSLRGGGEPAAVDPQGVPSHEDVPRLEDLTAESDLSVFLRDGVPEALKRAALRRMWSLDPGIRDFVGPAEYAWDFNNPDSIPGFGRAATLSEAATRVSGLPSAQGGMAGAGEPRIDGSGSAYFPEPTAIESDGLAFEKGHVVGGPAAGNIHPSSPESTGRLSEPVPSASPQDRGEHRSRPASPGPEDTGPPFRSAAMGGTPVDKRPPRHGRAVPR